MSEPMTNERLKELELVAPDTYEECISWLHEAVIEIRHLRAENERLKAAAKEEVAGLSFYEELLSEHRRALNVIEAVNQYSKLDDIMGKGGGIPSVRNRRDDALSHAKHLAAEFEGGGDE